MINFMDSSLKYGNEFQSGNQNQLNSDSIIARLLFLSTTKKQKVQ